MSGWPSPLKSLGIGAAVVWNRAVTVCAALIVTLHTFGSVPMHAPLHAVKPDAGVAVSATTPEKVAVHVPLAHVRPLGALVTVPEPRTVTVSGRGEVTSITTVLVAGV